MKQLLVISILLFLNSTLCAQIGEKDTVEVNRYKKKIAQNIDSIIHVANDCEVIYSNNGQFKFIHFRNPKDSLVFIEANYIEDHAGYIMYLKHEEGVYIFKIRGDGADNEENYFFIYEYAWSTQFLEFPLDLTRYSMEELYRKKDTVGFRNVLRYYDNYFGDNWTIKKIEKRDIDHYEKGYVVEIEKSINDVKYVRGHVFDLLSSHHFAYEKRYKNDSLLSQGGAHYEDHQIKYISQVDIVRGSLEKNNEYWDYDVKGYFYEIYKDGECKCIYWAEHLNHYSMIFEDKHKQKVKIIEGGDCIGVKIKE